MGMTLSEIVGAVKNNDTVDPNDLKYALLVYSFMFTMEHNELLRELISEKRTHEVVRKLKAENYHNMLISALDKPPKEYLGWNDDPENPEYQEKIKFSKKIFNNLLKLTEK